MARDIGEWQAIDRDGIAHVVPIEDLKPHSLDEQCWCGPTEDDGVLVHHSMDERESHETGRKAH